MSLFKKMMASVGIGSVKVNAVFEIGDGVRVGEELYGVAKVRGGNVAQEINRIHLYLYSNYYCEENGKIVEKSDRISHYYVDEQFTIEPGEEREIEFSFPIDLSTPITIGDSEVWVVTELDVESAIDQTDKDYITILPHPIVAGFFEALAQYGLRLKEVELLHVPDWDFEFPFVQEFRLVPKGRSGLEELEVFCVVGEDEVDFYMEIDRRAQGLTGLLEEVFDLDERRICLTLTSDDLEDPDRFVQMVIDSIEENLE